MALAASASPSRHRAFGLLLLLPWLAWADTEEELFWKDIGQVNEGELRLLDRAPDKPVHHLHNRIHIQPDSLDTGWVKLEQCHEQLDAFPRSQIVYHAERIRKLTITRRQGIARAWVEGVSIQLRDTRKGAAICIRGETRALEHAGERRFILRNGPYMRGFLDGFYPMRVSMSVQFEATGLRLIKSTPTPQAGFRLWQEAERVGYEAVFEGILHTTLEFEQSAGR
jgi:hypothetical protein